VTLAGKARRHLSVPAGSKLAARTTIQPKLRRAVPHRLKGANAHCEVHGAVLEQCEYEVTAGGRIWYCPDDERKIVWIVRAGTGHPKLTD